MSDKDSNKKNIEKFEGTFEKEKLGVTMIPNETIQSIRNHEGLGLYVYLLSQPDSWQLNRKQLCRHFECGRDKMYSLLNYLLEEGLITRLHAREEGKFTKPRYIVHLHKNTPKTQPDLAGGGLSPRPEKPDPAEPDTVNQDTYKTYNKENKERKKKHIASTNALVSSPTVNTIKSMPALDNNKEPTAMEIMTSNNPYEIDLQVLKDWYRARRVKRAPITKTVWNAILRELARCASKGLCAHECFNTMVTNGWSALKVEWFIDGKHNNNKGGSEVKDYIS